MAGVGELAAPCSRVLGLGRGAMEVLSGGGEGGLLVFVGGGGGTGGGGGGGGHEAGSGLLVGCEEFGAGVDSSKVLSWRSRRRSS